MLQADAEAWVPFAQLLESIDPAVRDAEEWSTVDVSHHLAGWMRQAAEVVGRNEGWGPLVLDEVNAGFLAESRDAVLRPGETRIGRSPIRGCARRSPVCPNPPSGAKRAFHDSTVDHYEEHLPMLRRLTGSDGSVA